MTTTASSLTKPGTVAFVGAGPGESALLTVRGAALIAAADLVVADPALPATAQAHGEVVLAVSPDLPESELATLSVAGAHPLVAALATSGRAAVAAEPHVPAHTDDPAGYLIAQASSGRHVVRLVAGDPLESAAVVAQARAVAAAGLALEIVPGVSIALGVAAHAGLAVGERFAVGEPAAGRVPTVLAECPAGEIGKVVASLAEQGRPGDTPVAVTSHGASTDQKTVVSTLDAVEKEAAALTGRVVITVGDAVATRGELSWFETKPLFGWTVLVPRTKDQAGVMSQRLRAYGAVPLEVPTIAVEPPRTAAPMERAIRGLVSGRYAWVAFTSTNAVRAIREKVEEYGLDARAFAGVKIAVVGEATAQAVRDWGMQPDLVPADQQSSEGLLQVWPEYDELLDPLDRVFLPRADIATETLVAGLKEGGWQVDDVTAYRTVRAAPPPAPIREALKGGRIDAVLFTSSSTVRNLVGIAGKPHDKTIIAVIGPHTEATARELGLRVDVQAAEASVPSLVTAVAEFAAARGDEPRPSAMPRRRASR